MKRKRKEEGSEAKIERRVRKIDSERKMRQRSGGV